MLPKPNFANNVNNNQLFNTSVISNNNWFQCSGFESQNKPLINNYNQLIVNSNQSSQSLTNYNNQNNYLYNNYNRNVSHFNNGLNGQNQYQNNRFNNNLSKYNNKSNNFNCDPCCRSFQTESQYKTHLSEHIVCGLDNCPFTAHPKVITSHQRMQHFCFRDKSLVKKIMTLDTPEDIQKWREERKKNFPTKACIERKKSEQTADNDNSFDGNNNNRNFNKKSRFRRNKKFNRFNNKNKRKHGFDNNCESNECEDVSNNESNHSLNQVLDSNSTDLKRIKLNSNNGSVEEGEIIDSDPEIVSKTIKTEINGNIVLKNEIIVETKKSGALNLLSAYDSDEDNDDTDCAQENDRELTHKLVNNIDLSEIKSIESKEKSIQLSIDSKNIKTEVNSETNSEQQIKCQVIGNKFVKKVDNKKSNKQKKRAFVPIKRKLTLYQKLLRSDIKNNEEKIMECIKHIVDKNFFQE